MSQPNNPSRLIRYIMACIDEFYETLMKEPSIGLDSFANDGSKLENYFTEFIKQKYNGLVLEAGLNQKPAYEALTPKDSVFLNTCLTIRGSDTHDLTQNRIACLLAVVSGEIYTYFLNHFARDFGIDEKTCVLSRSVSKKIKRLSNKSLEMETQLRKSIVIHSPLSIEAMKFAPHVDMDIQKAYRNWEIESFAMAMQYAHLLLSDDVESAATLETHYLENHPMNTLAYYRWLKQNLSSLPSGEKLSLKTNTTTQDQEAQEKERTSSIILAIKLKRANSQLSSTVVNFLIFSIFLVVLIFIAAMSFRATKTGDWNSYVRNITAWVYNDYPNVIVYVSACFDTAFIIIIFVLLSSKIRRQVGPLRRFWLYAFYVFVIMCVGLNVWSGIYAFGMTAFFEQWVESSGYSPNVYRIAYNLYPLAGVSAQIASVLFIIIALYVRKANKLISDFVIETKA